MANARTKPRTSDPERVPVKLESVTLTEGEGGYVFGGLAQAYNIVNDKLMIFRAGSGLKTIAERVALGKVKIHDGHPRDPNSDTIVGRVLSAAEGPQGVTYQGFLSATEKGLATKMQERIIDENSIELYVLRERPLEIALDSVPIQSRRYVDIAPSGLAIVREVLEWQWLAVGLVSCSSQGIRGILETPKMIPYQDLPLAARRTAFDALAARGRVEAWAGRGAESSARLSRAFLARAGYEGDRAKFAGLIADVVDGELVVVPGALDAAYAELETLFKEKPEILAAAARSIGRYEGRLRLTATPAEAHNPATSTVAPEILPETDRPEEETGSEPASEPVVAAAGPTSSPTAEGEGSGEAKEDDEADRLAKIHEAASAIAEL